MKISSKIHKFSDNIDTDVIIPARYCTTVDTQSLAEHCMYDLDDQFYSKVTKNDCIVAGHNFGCGSSREAAAIAIKGAGISCVIAKSFARIFYRNAINIGLMLIESSEAYDLCEYGQDITVDTEKRLIEIGGNSIEYKEGENSVVNDIISSGGLLNYIKKTKKVDNG